jgi:hypothetical protein
MTIPKIVVNYLIFDNYYNIMTKMFLLFYIIQLEQFRSIINKGIFDIWQDGRTFI